MTPKNLNLYRSNRTERLVAALADVLRAPTGDAFARDVVVVHSQGLERWLSMQLAHHLDICANVAFQFPGDLLAEAVSAWDPQADLSGWASDRLLWSVHAELQRHLDRPDFAEVKRWLNDDGGPHIARRLVDLAARVATLFERYATYRAHEVVNWTASDGDWQHTLWVAVRDRMPGSDPATLCNGFIDALGGDAVDLGTLANRICVFSVSTLPPLHVRMLARLARHREVHLFVLAGTPMKREFEHPLLASMGTLNRDFQDAIDSADPPCVEPLGDLFEDPGADTMLHALQSDILHDRVGVARKLDGVANIRVHSCHSPIRQVQVLRDVLLELFEADHALQPREILVMTPDMETYAPLVQAIFADGEEWQRRDKHPGGLPAIPYRLADRGSVATNPAAGAPTDSGASL